MYCTARDTIAQIRKEADKSHKMTDFTSIIYYYVIDNIIHKVKENQLTIEYDELGKA